ncbi:hypothetical protein [Lysobacter soli]|uniref:hypothetical protein n=1 Tax=Lysobacter soli TaxID=453783 RepID=UPI0015F27DD4|nr:hypothetical protein [Lysobacter soli]
MSATTFAMQSMHFDARPASHPTNPSTRFDAHPERVARRVARVHRRARSEVFRGGVRGVAHRTVTFRNALRLPQKQNRPHEAAGR